MFNFVKFISTSFNKQQEVEWLENEGSVYKTAELFLQNGTSCRLVPGWSKALLRSLEENNLKEIADAVRPSK